MKLKETIDNFKYLSEEKREESCSLFPKKGGSQFQVYKPNTASDNVMNYIFPDDNQNVREKNINTAKRVLSDKVRFSIPTINNDTDFGSTNGLVDVSDAMAIAIMYEYLNNKLKQNSVLKNKTIEDLIKDKINKFSDISNSIKKEKEEVKKNDKKVKNNKKTIGINIKKPKGNQKKDKKGNKKNKDSKKNNKKEKDDSEESSEEEEEEEEKEKEEVKKNNKKIKNNKKTTGINIKKPKGNQKKDKKNEKKKEEEEE
jgi:hypothetical protein